MSADARALLAAHLRQRRELGDGELVLGRHTAPELTAALAEQRRASTAATSKPAEGVLVASSADFPSTEEILQIGDLARLREVALGCPRCTLAETRQQVVFGEGDANARVMVVGEAPGADEDRTGRPFVGRAGKLLDLLLASVGLPRESVYICNVLKCRPPGNRNPAAEEVEACSPYLIKQVELIAPSAIVAFGTFAAQTLLATRESIGRLRGGTHSYRGVPLVSTYHPAALLRNPAWVLPVWRDLQRVRALLEAA